MPKSKPRKNIPRKKVLVVEDEPILASMYMTVLKRVEADIYGAKTRQEGERIIERVVPDLVLLDLMIPSTTIQDTEADFHDPVGLKLLAGLRKNPATKKMKVIILSNLDADEQRKQAMALGAIDYLVKSSLPPQAVVDRVNLVLRAV
jgi:two-component system phosphate regulon response regulator PhoB